jgi:MFS family permease
MMAPMRVAAICLAVGLVLADSSVAVLALPAIYRELDVALGDLHWVLTAFNLVLAVAAVPAAPLVRRAAGPSFSGGLVVFALASLGCALAPGFGVLVGLRAVQAVGGAVVVVAALALLPGLVGSQRRGVAVWVAAGTVGAALGPAAGGVLTETISWRAVFAVQAPLAVAALPFCLGLRGPGGAGEPRSRVLVGPNVALALVSAGLAAALFLVVLLLIEGWGLSPIQAAAVVTALPLAALVTARLAGHVPDTRARSAAGATLVTGGLAALGLLPGADWGWTIAPQVLVGAGLALAFSGLSEAALVGRGPQELHGAVTVAARHAGIVLGLLLLTPLLVADLDRQSVAAEEAGAARLLDARIAPRTKLQLAGALASRLGDADGSIPDLAPAFASIEPEDEDRSRLARLQASLDDIVDRAVTSAFSRPFLLGALLSLAAVAVAVITVPRRREA